MNHKSCILFLFFYLIISCESPKLNTLQPVTETPKALQANSTESITKSYRSVDLIDELYTELAEKSEDLKKLETKIEEAQQKPSTVNHNFEKYDEKSKSYYNSAKDYTNRFGDSTLKKEILRIIENSEIKYNSKAKEYEYLMRIIRKNHISINDKHSILKILVTLPEIQKFQNQNAPAKKDYNDLLNEQQKTMKRIDSLTPKY